MTELPTAQGAHFRFLDLPLELRHLIYRYLVPATPFIPADGIQLKRSRRGGRWSTLGILAANRQIYHEVKGEWYSIMQHEVKIDQKQMALAGTRVGLRSKKLNNRMGWIRNMRLVVELKIRHVHSPAMKFLVQYLLSIPDLQLRYIDLAIALIPRSQSPWMTEATEKEEKAILTILQHNFDADFLKLKGMVICRSWTLDSSRASVILGFDGREAWGISENVDRFEKIAIQYFEQLAKRINPPKTKFTYLGKIRQ